VFFRNFAEKEDRYEQQQNHTNHPGFAHWQRGNS
jgi:hypothetical protein